MAVTLSKQKLPDLSIVIPAYCEEKRIGASLDELADFLRLDSFFNRKSVEVLVVAADSPDRTHQIAKAIGKKFKNFELLMPGSKVGKGRDVQFGMLQATGKFIVYMDADLATPLHHLEQLYKVCGKGNDLVIGTRNLLTYRTNPFRRTVSIIGNILFRLAGGVWIEDSQCGFKMFRSDASQLCFSRLTLQHWGFDMEVLAIARANNLKIRAYRIDDWQDMPHSTFTDSVLLVSLRSLKDLGHIMLNRIKGKYTS